MQLLKTEDPEQAIIFCRTKIGASKLERTLSDKGLDVKALHGDMSQGSRDGVMIAFKDHRVKLLVATDIAARGLDIEHVTHVINYDVPASSEVYVHRIGRTGRVGRTGRAITLVTPAQRDEIGRIERDVKTSIGEWESPEERLEHAPRPRRRERPSAGSAEPRRGPKATARAGAGEDAEESGDWVKLFVNRGERSGITEEDLRWALQEGAVLPEEAIHDVRVLHRFSFVEVDPGRRRAHRRVPRRHQVEGQRDPARGREELRPGEARRSARRCREQRLEVDRLADVAADLEALAASPSVSRWALTISAGVSTPPPRSSRRASIPDLRGIIASSSSRSGRGSSRRSASITSLAVGGGLDLVPLHLQPGPHQQQDRLRVVGDQDAGHHGASAPSGGAASGQAKLKVEPSPGVDSAAIVPPCSSTSDFEIARPSPVPPTRWVMPASPRVKRSKMCSSWSCGYPRSVVDHPDLHFVTGLLPPLPGWTHLRRSTHSRS